MDRTRPRAWRALVRSESASRARIARSLVLGSPARRPASAQAAAPPALVPGRSCPASVPGPSPSPSRAALARAASVINRRPGSLRRARCPRRGLVGRSIPAALPSIRAAMMLAQAKAEAGARPHGLPPPSIWVRTVRRARGDRDLLLSSGWSRPAERGEQLLDRAGPQEVRALRQGPRLPLKQELTMLKLAGAPRRSVLLSHLLSWRGGGVVRTRAAPRPP